MKRPLSISIIAWYLIVFYLLSLFIVVMGFYLICDDIAGSYFATRNLKLELECAYALFNCVLFFVCAIGFLKGWNWTRWLFVYWDVWGYILNFMENHGKNNLTQDLTTFLLILIDIAIMYLLFGAKANVWFSEKNFLKSASTVASELGSKPEDVKPEDLAKYITVASLEKVIQK